MGRRHHLAAVAALALLTLSACKADTSAGDVAAGMAVAVAATGEELDRAAPDQGPWRVQALWAGSADVTCGVATAGNQALRFMELAPMEPDRLRIEQSGNWEEQRWADACGDKSVMIYKADA